MSKKDYKELSAIIKNSLRIAEKEILRSKAERNEMLVLWNSDRQQIERIPAREYVSGRS